MLRATSRLWAAMPALTRFQTKLFINGAFVDAASGRTFEVVNPATEAVITRVAEADVADVDRAVVAARAAFQTFRTTDGTYRRDLMRRLADLIHTHREELAALESVDNGKPYPVALHADVSLAEACFRYYAGWADKISGAVAPVSGPNVAFTRREPIGVCGQIIPWNFPLLMAAWKLAPALAAGNAVVLKPAEQTPLSALRLAELLQEAGYPAGVVNILPGFGATAGAAIASHMDVDKVAFTGSTAVGHEVMQMAARSNLKPVTLELGGKSPLVVCDDADLDEAARVAAAGIYFNCGQVCTAASRLFVHERVHDAFVAKLCALAQAHRIGPGDDPACDLGPVVSARQLERVLGYIRAGAAAGARVACGGARGRATGYFVQPTVFTDVTDDMAIAREEIFGPVTCVLKYATLEEALRRANATPYGLAAGICTPDVNKVMRFASFVQAGTVWVNTWNRFDAAMPFGGFKQSGIGRELGPEGLHLYTQVKSVFIALNGPLVK